MVVGSCQFDLFIFSFRNNDWVVGGIKFDVNTRIISGDPVLFGFAHRIALCIVYSFGNRCARCQFSTREITFTEADRGSVERVSGGVYRTHGGSRIQQTTDREHRANVERGKRLGNY